MADFASVAEPGAVARGRRARRLRAVGDVPGPARPAPALAMGRCGRVSKRGMDVVLASVMLVLALPVLLAAAIAVKMHDRGPVLFCQHRVGRDGKRFRLYKLRSMVPGAEDLQAPLRAENRRDGPLFKLAHDPRVTRVGHFLRAASIDELPQLVNVLRGDMSLVGPRPALPDEVLQFDDELLQRLHLLPGITGLWQVEARDDPSFESYRHHDLHYLEHWSLALDVRILLTTVGVVVRRSLRALRRPNRIEADALVLLD